ncbi:MAG: yehU 2 [Gammaproteobacteria bacterium]|jgi:two-component system LytT family sensor kinase|nr:yehU 2 [Gammaproteobacteria bacterium]
MMAISFPFVPRWLCFFGLWLLLAFVFASQLFWAGYVTPWSKAFSQEVVYWLSWGILAPVIFWMCRRLHDGGQTWSRYALGLVLGALVASVVQPVISESIRLVQSGLSSWLSIRLDDQARFAQGLHLRIIRNAGINLPVYVGIALAWHAATYYRELRDRQLKSSELESLLHRAQLQALRSQLNPHFLFNTLHSIAELVHENPKLAEQLILRLGELLRQMLRSSTLPDVPLAEEIDFVRGYVEIEQMRLGERLQVRWDVEPEALGVRVPSLILQPLVENAIQHGIAPLAAMGSLTIRAWREHGFLHLQVRDTGLGLSSESRERRSGIGLSNTRARLERLYDGQQRLELIGDNGLVVNLCIPLSAAATGAAHLSAITGSSTTT